MQVDKAEQSRTKLCEEFLKCLTLRSGRTREWKEDDMIHIRKRDT